MDEISGELTQIFNQLLSLVNENEKFLVLGNQIKKEFYGLAVLEQVDECLQNIKEEENVIPIGEFNHLISKEIQSQPMPYIYERMGEKYTSFFIDEFQDTSVMQWQNLLPLINNAMAQGGYCLLVGDAKQSIYRWRGGDAEQFIDLYENKDDSNKIVIGNRKEELYGRSIENLANNWRSRKEIVFFNNDLYQSYSSNLTTEAYKEIYNESSQIPKGKEGGFVQLEIIEEKDKEIGEEIFVQKTKTEINKALDAGFSYKDICVLVKKNSYATRLLQSFTLNNIPAYASGALTIKNAREVQWVISVLKWMMNPEREECRLELLKQALSNKLINLPEEQYHQFLSKGLSFSTKEFIDFLDEMIPEVNRIIQESYFLYDICERLLIECEVWDGDNMLITSFLNEVHNFSIKKEAIVPSFLNWWDEVSDNLTIDPPEDLNQVAVMTVHKSKGLEFPVVILPFADWSLAKSSLDKDWINLPEELNLPSGLLGFSKASAELLGGTYQEKYEELSNQAHFDNLNVLYVASTRARDVLIILSQERRGASICDVFKSMLEFRNLDFKTNFQYTWGLYPSVSKRELKTHGLSKKPIFSIWQENVRISNTSPIGWPFEKEDPTSWGKKVHHVLSKIRFEDDVDKELKIAISKGDIDVNDFDRIQKIVMSIISHLELRGFYQKDLKIFNERNILIPSTGARRPDRLVKTKDGWVIIDYKTGSPKEKDKDQVEQYASLLSKSSQVKEKILVYIDDGVDVVKWV